MSRKLIIPEYSHRGIVISIYHSGDRFSAHFLLNRPPKKRIERRSELEAVEAARHIIDEAIRNGEASAQEQSVDQILQNGSSRLSKEPVFSIRPWRNWRLSRSS